MCDSLNRRDFLRQAGFAGLGLGFGSRPSNAANKTESAEDALPPAKPAALSPVDRFNYIVGTQTFDANYHFTEKPRLLETAEAIREMGASVIKLTLSWDKQRGPKPEKIRSLRDVVVRDPVIRAILELPFGHYLLWAYPDGRDSDASKNRDPELYDLCCQLLRAWSGSGKTFYLGHWEGDWELRGRAGSTEDPTPPAIERKIRWLNLRQQAVDDAKRDTPHQEVDVFCYTEVNLVRDAMKGRPTMTNEVVPHTKIDYVSYSSYDTTNQRTPELGKALNYIESKLPAKAGIEGKRVWIGEYGFPAINHSPREQDLKSREVIATALRWGCPFVLYWEMFNNEVTPEGKQRGFWLIDNNGLKQPVYHTHQKLCQWGRDYVAQSLKRTGKVPSTEAYRKAALGFLNEME